MPSPTPAQNEDESRMLVSIPPMGGEFELSITTPIENNMLLSQATDLSWGTLIPCNPGDQGWCAMLQIGDVVTYTDYSDVNAPEHISINRTNQGIIEFRHELPDFITTPFEPSWGKVDNPENPNHYRLAFLCYVTVSGTQYYGVPCYWDSNARDYFYHLTTGGNAQISPDGLKIAYTVSNLLYIWDLQNNTHSAPVNSPFGDIYGIRWSDANTLYYVAVSSFSFNSPKLMYRLNLSVNPPITENINLDIPSPRNLQPYIFDVSSGNVLYWTYDLYTIPANRYGLNDFPPSSFITYSSGGYPIYWSPRLDGQAILIDYEFNPVTNQTDVCIHVSNYASLPTAPRVDCRQMGLGYLDWAGNIDLSAFIAPPTTGDCPDPSSLPSGSVDYYIAELCQYGITAFPNGLPTTQITINFLVNNVSTNLDMDWHSTQYTYNNPWQASRLEDILAGVEKTALAFDMLANEINPTNTEDAKTLFRRIMGNFYVLNVDNGFQIYPGDGCNGTASSSCTSNTIGAITFYSMIPNQYTMVHEIGHRFNARSDGGSGRTLNSLYGRMKEAIVCNGVDLTNNNPIENWCPSGALIFGVADVELTPAQITIATNNGWGASLRSGRYISDWRRGERGWGSGPASDLVNGEVVTLNITDFQQHSYMIEDWLQPIGSAVPDGEEDTREFLVKEIDEATSDMFLNWVYRRTTSGLQGFLNINWLLSNCRTPQGCSDDYPSGDIRYRWMNQSMSRIFQERNWR
jgi:hypothetical protein